MLALLWLAFALLLVSSKAQPRADTAREVVVITSFPNSFYEPFRRAFELKEPLLKLRIHNRKTTAAVSMIMDNALAQADIFWASAPDAFEVLSKKGHLVSVPGRAQNAPGDIAGFPIDDPAGLFKGFSVSGYGMMWNSTLLQRQGLAYPSSIVDLADPRFRGLIAMSSPSRSGTTHLMVETVLQRYGWEKGWETWLGVAANLATVTARSFSVSAGVQSGRYAIGLSIDFLGRAARPAPRSVDDVGTAAGKDVPEITFGYPEEIAFLPASIALLASANNREGAEKFIKFVLSSEGQKLLTDKRINRQPVDLKQTDPAHDDLFALSLSKQSTFVFDAKLSGRRYEMVNILFDELITERLSRLQRFWRIHDALRSKTVQRPDLHLVLDQAKNLALRLSPELIALVENSSEISLRRIPRGVPLPSDQSLFVERVRQAIEGQFGEAERLLDRVNRQLANQDGRSSIGVQ